MNLVKKPSDNKLVETFIYEYVKIYQSVAHIFGHRPTLHANGQCNNYNDAIYRANTTYSQYNYE